MKALFLACGWLSSCWVLKWWKVREKEKERERERERERGGGRALVFSSKVNNPIRKTPPS